MLDLENIPVVGGEEHVARHIFSSSHINKLTGTIKQDAFMPPNNHCLSVTGRLETTPEEILADGRRIALLRMKPLHGIADIAVTEFMAQKLAVVASPLLDNPNHADVIRWPTAKCQQKAIALKIAEVATLLPIPQEIDRPFHD